VEKALDNYFRSDKLEGDNKYACDTCAEKTEALKGQKFINVPQILTLQLKRFDLDYTTFQRKKIDDRVSFPFLLDLNKYLSDVPILTPSVSVAEEADTEVTEAETTPETDVSVPVFVPEKINPF
jgi:ubiquitin C-terminal hydrolase